ncbi:hypothetical protein TeGR_g8598, partial [Tetraparma gracilis]
PRSGSRPPRSPPRASPRAPPRAAVSRYRPPPKPSPVSQLLSGASAAASTGSAFVARQASLARERLPPPAELKRRAAESAARAADLTGRYTRELKGMMSSELEQVLLKATRPSDVAVKPKHAERLVGVTYQISGQYDLYDPILRKLWAKMAEMDMRTNIKALYVLHRFASDGSPDHAASLKSRLRELRRTRDPKRKANFFNSRQLLTTSADPDMIPFKAFMARYAQYVLARSQCFGGQFLEVSSPPPPAKGGRQRPLTDTCLRLEHLEQARLVLKNGVACKVKDEE